MSGSARERHFFLRPELIEQILLCDFSDDDDEVVTNLENEDVLFLENDNLQMQNDEPIEVVIEGTKYVDLPLGTVYERGNNTSIVYTTWKNISFYA